MTATDNSPVSANALYFIADAHLGNRHHRQATPSRERLYAFWRSIGRPGNTLYILGDLFDFWFEWPEAIPQRHFQTLVELRRLVEAGVEVHLLPGNHDFHFGPVLRSEVGVQTHPEPHRFEWGGKRWLVRHGDGLNPDDHSYLRLKRVLRNPLNIALYRLLPPALGMAIADFVSSRSSRRQTPPPSIQLQHMERYAGRQLQEGIDFVVMGHIHYPTRGGADQGQWVILGDWINQFSYACFDGNALQLKEFSPDDNL